jgi:CO/xanthine dehydrogenase FAD-binding subunit
MVEVEVPASAAAPPAIREDKVAFVRRMRARRDQGRRLRVVVNLGLVAGLVSCGQVAFGQFVTFGCRSKQSEARSVLAQIATAQRAEQTETGHFVPVVDPRTSDARRRYVVVPGRVTPTTFEAFAVGLDPAGDLWRVTAHTPVEQLHDACDR